MARPSRHRSVFLAHTAGRRRRRRLRVRLLDATRRPVASAEPERAAEEGCRRAVKHGSSRDDGASDTYVCSNFFLAVNLVG